MLEVSKHCFYMLHKDAYKVHLISGSLILQFVFDVVIVTKVCQIVRQTLKKTITTFKTAVIEK